MLKPHYFIFALLCFASTKVFDFNLYTQFAENKNSPLVVLFGGSEGGNFFAEEGIKSYLDKLNQKGISTLSIGYFAAENAPDKLEHISLDKLYDSIQQVASQPNIASECINLFGVSRGAELALLLASYYADINSVTAAYPSHVAWNSISYGWNTTASWTYQGKPVEHLNAPFLSYDMLKGIVTGNYLDAFYHGLDNPKNLQQAKIKVENINGSILLLSAKEDEVWPSHYMAKEIITRLQQKQFTYPFRHIAFEGGHMDSLLEAWQAFEQHLDETINQQVECRVVQA